MPGKRHAAKRIFGPLRQAEAELAQGRTVEENCRGRGVSEASVSRWWSEYGGLTVDQARRLKHLERETARLKRAVAKLTSDKQILTETAAGNFQAPSAAVLACGMCSRCSGCPSVAPVARSTRRDRRGPRCGWCGPARLL